MSLKTTLTFLNPIYRIKRRFQMIEQRIDAHDRMINSITGNRNLMKNGDITGLVLKTLRALKPYQCICY